MMPVNIYLRDNAEMILEYVGTCRSEDRFYFSGFVEDGGGPPCAYDDDEYEEDTRSGRLVLFAERVDWAAIEQALIEFIRENKSVVTFYSEG